MGILTKEEEASIKKTWALCAKDLKGVGVKFFLHFFKQYPQYQRIFKGFADVPLEQLAGNVRLAAHAFTVMTAIGGLVYNLDDADVLNELLIRAGRNHSRRHLKIEDFNNLKKSLLDFFGKALGDAFTPAANAAWTKLLTVMMTKIGEGLAQGAPEGS